MPERPSESYAESFSVDGIDLNEEFKYMPDDSVPQQVHSTRRGAVVHILTRNLRSYFNVWDFTAADFTKCLLI